MWPPRWQPQTAAARKKRPCPLLQCDCATAVLLACFVAVVLLLLMAIKTVPFLQGLWRLCAIQIHVLLTYLLTFLLTRKSAVYSAHYSFDSSFVLLQDIRWRDSVVCIPQPSAAIGLQSTLLAGHVCTYSARSHRGTLTDIAITVDHLISFKF